MKEGKSGSRDRTRTYDQAVVRSQARENGRDARGAPEVRADERQEDITMSVVAILYYLSFNHSSDLIVH